MAKQPSFPSDFRAIKSLERKYKGKTTRPVDQSKMRVKVKPTARKQPEVKTAPMPSASGTLRTLGGIAANAPSALADLAVSVPKAAYDYVRTTSPLGVLSDVKSAASDFANFVRENPAEAFIETVAGTPKAAGELLREATLARDAGDEERAAQIEKLAVPMLLAAAIPGGRAAKGAGKAAKAEKSLTAKRAKPEPGRPYTGEEMAVYEKFGSKQEQEGKRAKQVATSEKRSQRQLSGKRGKVSPTVYREMQAKEGPEAVLAAAKKGEHLKRTESGYTGFPRTVQNPSGLGVMRRNLDLQVQDAANAIKLADPENLGNWYQRARAGMAESTEPYQLPRVLEQHGVYSAGVSPESELGFALKHLNSRALGEPSMAFRGAGQETLDSAVANNRLAVLGDKTGEYMKKQDPRVPSTGLFGVNDFRWAQSMGYTDPQGNPWKAAVSSTMHPVMDAETALMTQRANERAMGGKTDWLGEQMQEIPWVYGKAQDLYSRGNSPSGRFGGEPIEGMKAALLEANKTPADYFPKHTMSGTYEYAPGASTGHLPEVISMTPEAKRAYGARGAWAQPSPETSAIEAGLIDVPPSVGAGDRDVLYSAAGFRQLPTIESAGAYKNMAGEWEYNPLNIARPLVDYPTGGGARIAPLTENAVTALERFRAVADAQEAGAANLPNTLRSLSGKNALLLDTGGVQPTSEQLQSVIEGLGPMADKYGVTATNRGAYVFPYDPEESGKSLRGLDEAYLSSLLPGSTPVKAGGTGVYTPGIGKWGEEGIVPTEPYSGEATIGLLEEFAQNPQELAMKVGESESVREALRQKYLRDLEMKNEGAAGYRGDIQNTRRFLAEADWPKVVELIRNGVSPVAALAALGYSASALAATPEE